MKGKLMNTDALGRLIKVGDVCGFASRRHSQLSLEAVIIREVRPDGVKGDKIVREFVPGTGWVSRLVTTKLIVRTEHLVITGITEEEVRVLMQVKKEKR